MPIEDEYLRRAELDSKNAELLKCGFRDALELRFPKIQGSSRLPVFRFSRRAHCNLKFQS